MDCRWTQSLCALCVVAFVAIPRICAALPVRHEDHKHDPRAGRQRSAVADGLPRDERFQIARAVLRDEWKTAERIVTPLVRVHGYDEAFGLALRGVQHRVLRLLEPASPGSQRNLYRNIVEPTACAGVLCRIAVRMLFTEGDVLAAAAMAQSGGLMVAGLVRITTAVSGDSAKVAQGKGELAVVVDAVSEGLRRQAGQLASSLSAELLGGFPSDSRH